MSIAPKSDNAARKPELLVRASRSLVKRAVASGWSITVICIFDMLTRNFALQGTESGSKAVQHGMHDFILDPPTARSHIERLLNDASSTTPTTLPPLPTTGPVAGFAAALSAAVDAANHQAELLAAEARRTAGTMDTLVTAAERTDWATGDAFGRIQQ